MRTKKLVAPLSGAHRLQAYRRRLSESEMVRTETLLPKAVSDSAQEIARTEGLKYQETVSALVQMGLEAYQAQTQAPIAPPNLVAQCFGAAVPPAPTPGALLRSANVTVPASASISPLARFLKARKDAT
jgi:hypothetical protein